MAEFVINSTNSRAVRKGEVLAFEIQPFSRPQEEGPPREGYHLLLKMARTYDPDVVFEEAATLQEINQLALAFKEQLES